LHQGDAARALPVHQEALTLFAKLGDADRCADLSWKIALSLEKLGRHAEAIDTCGAALLGAPQGIARTRLGELMAQLRGIPVEEAVAEIMARPAGDDDAELAATPSPRTKPRQAVAAAKATKRPARP
jgi:tetratricopeptide (TPR) repeat protein